MFLVGLIIGAVIGFMIVSLLIASKDKSKQEAEEYEVAENNLRNYYTKPFDDVKLDSFKDNLKIILKHDIDFYNRLYQINKSAYYLGRVEQSKFILNITERKNGEEDERK